MVHRTDVDVVAKRKYLFIVLAGNRTPVVQAVT
jgi:hypothetical protein